MDNERCYFYTNGRISKCTILEGEPCTPEREKECKFRKTEREYYEARNKAIDINKRKGNCINCKYKAFACLPTPLDKCDSCGLPQKEGQKEWI